MLKRILLVLLVAALVAAMMVASSLPAFAQNNAGKSLDNRNEKSLQSTFGQCHQSPFLEEDLEPRIYNPNPNNAGEAACRNVGDIEDAGSAPILFSLETCLSEPAGLCPRLSQRPF
jgi:hypothetical protein